MSEMAIPALAEWLNREQAAEYICQRTGVRMTAGILANRAHMGDGPAYRIWRGRGVARGGRGRFAVYQRDELDRWIAAQLCEPSETAMANGAIG